jgi:hypothetical protein
MPEDDNAAIVDVLRECLSHLERSTDSGWSTGSVAALKESVAQMIAQLDQGRSANPQWLGILFAPTGDLQETAIDNGWGEAFLDLAARFERAIR